MVQRLTAKLLPSIVRCKAVSQLALRERRYFSSAFDFDYGCEWCIVWGTFDWSVAPKL